MFGIGLPEMIVIMAIALIVVGPDKLPDLARSAAKWMLELKKTAETLKKELTEDGTLDSLKSDLHNAALDHKNNLLESSDQSWKTLTPGEGVNPAPDKTEAKIIEAEITVVDDDKPASPAPPDAQTEMKVSEPPAHPGPEKDQNVHPAC
jgi:sec-independent protein translocase protein TatB